MGDYWGGVQHYCHSSLWVSCSGMFSCTPDPLFPRNVYSLSTYPGVFRGELVFTQKWSGEGCVMRTRAAVVIFEWVTSFFADSCEGLLGGQPWISHTLFQRVRRKFLVYSRIHLMRNWRHLWILHIMPLGISSNLWVRTGWGHYSESGNVVLVSSLRNSEDYEVHLPHILKNPFIERIHVICEGSVWGIGV